MKTVDVKKMTDRIRACAGEELADGRIGGCSLIVRQNGEILYQDCFGARDPSTGDPVREDTLFRLASMTKPITAAAVLLLMDRGLLRPDDTVDRFLPEYREMKVGKPTGNRQIAVTGTAAEKIRISHLLTHTSGLCSGDTGIAQTLAMTPEQKRTLRTATDYFSGTVLAFEPASQAMYSPVAGFDVLARIVEIVSGKPFDRFLKDEIFDPAGMKDTTFCPTPEQWNRTAVMHDRADGRSVAGNFPDHTIFADFPLTYFCGGAGLISSRNDYSAFAEMLLNEGKLPGGTRLLSEEAVRRMGTPQIPASLAERLWTWGLPCGSGSRRIRSDSIFRSAPTVGAERTERISGWIPKTGSPRSI